MVKKLGIVIGLVLAMVVAGLAYVWFSGGSGEPSTEITAPPVIATAAAQPESEPPESEPPESEPEDVVPQDSAGEDPDTGTAPTTGTSEADASGTTMAEDPDASAPVIYQIDKAASSVRFEINEILNGNPKRVVGVTTEVAGEMLIDFGDPAASRLGAVVINVRTLETDSNFRNRAMRGPILDSASDENEFATFEPTDIEGLPDRVTVGDRVSLSVTGDFTLRGVTRAVVFDTEVMLVSADRIEISGSATVLRSEFGLDIPEVPSVSHVEDEILLVIDLAAVASEQ